ncbi:MAG: hypothetical protein COV70_01170 [Parcubacteria group bacterium CG11_big_fil_rev_8_21_14_0_20_39_22]|nr:MAG: hypothetical protein COV70_01170 [Parcubacteria group bacterium CG11_big_fil_rev_8_21_14_0_20_39_22]
MDLRLQRQNSQIFERVVCDKYGRLVRVTVSVREENNRFYGRIISILPITSIKGEYEKYGLFLNGLKEKIKLDIPICYGSVIESQYFNIFEFFTSQMPRAPSSLLSPFSQRVRERMLGAT